jgi:hypothetical protein
MKEHKNRLTPIGDVGHDRHGHRLMRYRCACGEERVILEASVRTGNTCSCGCLQRELTVTRSRARVYPIRSLEERFWEKVDKTGSIVRSDLGSCWIWIGARSPFGYGCILVRTIRGTRTGVNEQAHRVAWTLLRGAIPEGACVLHKCDVPACCNPEHLFLGTQAENIRDMIAKGRQAPPEKTRHVGSRHGRSKLTEADIPEIRAGLARGETKSSLARRYGVSEALVYCIEKKRAWRHV